MWLPESKSFTGSGGQNDGTEQQRSDVVADTSGPGHSLSNIHFIANASTAAIQRQVIQLNPEEEKQKRFAARNMQAIANESTIVKKAEDCKQSNCHDFVFGTEHGACPTGSSFVKKATMTQPIIVFCSDNDIDHSGFIRGHTFAHYLIGIGQVSTSMAAVSKMGYAKQFSLPIQNRQFKEYCMAHKIEY